jgi:alpha-N-arabinofuranosidase
MKTNRVFTQSLPILTAGLLAISVHGRAQDANPASPDAGTSGPPASLTLDLQTPGAGVSPTLYGLMTEEINHSYDGGIYGELIQNRIFKDNDQTPDHWSVVQEDGGSGTIALDQTQPISKTALTTCLKLSVVNGGKRVGIANDGFWGIPVKAAITSYNVSYYAKSSGAAASPLTVSVESNDGVTVYATAQAPSPTNEWAKYTVTLPAITTKTMQPTTGRFVISTTAPGTYWFNLVSVFPPTFHDRPNGNRPDLMQILSDMRPKFLRLPGGNFLEGDLISTRYPWKQTLGDLSQRPGHPGCWKYRASDGMGLLEFLEWCEDLNIQPVLAVYAGYSLKGDHVEPGPSLQPFVDDALDEIEYVTGDTNTKWGGERARDGHPQPFPLTYVEIGNEDGFDKSGSYDGRFTQFYDAIKAKYPNLKLIATVGGQDNLGRREPVKTRKPDVYDEHYYRSAGQMEEDANHYDRYSRTGPKTFVGEWATREGRPATNLNAALGDAAWMTGMERNSDVVVLASYAPLFVNVEPGAMQWPSDLIGYNALSSYGSPSYYAQKMFNTYLGDTLVPLTAQNVPTQTWQPPARRNTAPPPAKQLPVLFFSATRASHSGTIYLKVVNAGKTAQTVSIDLKGAKQVSPDGVSVVLTSANPQDTNSITDPVKIVPVTSKISGIGANFSQTFAPYSVNVLQLEAR